MDKLKRILSFYEEIIDVGHYRNLVTLHKKAKNFEPIDRILMLADYPANEFIPYSIEEIHQDAKKMMYNELIACFSSITTKSAAFPMIRANYGVGTLASAFGAKSVIINGNMPWIEHLSKEAIKRIIKKGVPDYGPGLDAKGMETYELYREVLSAYPKCSQAVRLFHPDYQGPLDVAHLLLGSDIYLEMYTDPGLIHDLLSVVTDTYIDRMKRIKPLLNDEENGFCYHWGDLYPGRILLRNDSAVNLSPEMYYEFVKPYDDRILKEIGPASMHYCGRADHLVFEMPKSEHILGMNFGHMRNQEFGKAFLDFIHSTYRDMQMPVITYVLYEDDFEAMDFETHNTGITFKITVTDQKKAEEMLKKCGW